MTPAPEQNNTEFEAGMLDYQARNAIRELIALYGFPEAREKIAFMLLDECDRTARRVRQ